MSLSQSESSGGSARWVRVGGWGVGWGAQGGRRPCPPASLPTTTGQRAAGKGEGKGEDAGSSGGGGGRGWRDTCWVPLQCEPRRWGGEWGPRCRECEGRALERLRFRRGRAKPRLAAERSQNPPTAPEPSCAAPKLKASAPLRCTRAQIPAAPLLCTQALRQQLRSPAPPAVVNDAMACARFLLTSPPAATAEARQGERRRGGPARRGKQRTDGPVGKQPTAADGRGLACSPAAQGCQLLAWCLQPAALAAAERSPPGRGSPAGICMRWQRLHWQCLRWQRLHGSAHLGSCRRCT